MKNVEQGHRPGTAVTDPVSPPRSGGEDVSTRRRVSQSILEHGPSTAAQLATRLDVTPAAIRRHLDALTDCGHVTASAQRVYGGRGRGRPAKAFALTDNGRADFYQAYDELAIDALHALADTGGEQAVGRLARRRQSDIENRFASLNQQRDGNDPSPAEALAEALSAEGYAATVEPAVAGQQVCQHHCPVANVAAEFPQLCEAETEAFSQLLGVHVQRLATIAHGDGVCTTHVPAAPDGVRETFRSKFKPESPGQPRDSSHGQDHQPTNRKASAI